MKVWKKHVNMWIPTQWLLENGPLLYKLARGTRHLQGSLQVVHVQFQQFFMWSTYLWWLTGSTWPGYR